MAVLLAVVTSVVVVVSPTRAEVPAARIAVALFIGLLVTSEARSSGNATRRALAMGAVAVGVAMILATLKLALK